MMDGFMGVKPPLPYQDLFGPTILAARAELRRRTDPACYGLLKAEAHAGWEKYLLKRLTFASAKAAHWQFQIFKTVRQAFPKTPLANCSEPNPLYREFIGTSPDARLRKLYGEFPVLAVVCAGLTNSWLDTTREFLSRLQADYGGFNGHFERADNLGSVVAIHAGLSDPHRGGRCVVEVRFENGSNLIYKPRSLAPEAHFATMLDLLNQKAVPHLLRSACCWDRGEYGWMEFIERADCSVLTDVHSFYWRAGALLGVAYLARGVDFHRENLIAAGSFPVAIDLEALWHPQKPGAISRSLKVDSVLRTGFLPRRDLQLGTTYELSALGSQMRSGQPVATWICVNQDRTTLQIEPRNYPNQTHLPVLNGVVHLAPDFEPDIQAGFQWVGEKLLETQEGREQLAAWLHVLTECLRRKILRVTARYQLTLDHLTLPRSLRDQQKFESELMELNKIGDPAAEQELAALEQLDVPYFNQSSDDGDNDLVDATFRRPFREHYAAQRSVIAQALAESR